MAKQPEDTMTAEMFTVGDKALIRQAIETHLATLRRQVNTEKNPQIKEIRRKDLQDYLNLVNKVDSP